MIDILLVLLIVFMAIAPVQSKGLNAAVPRPGATNERDPQPENPVVLEIAADGSYAVNSEKIAASALGERLIAIFERRGERVLFVKAAPGLEFAEVTTPVDIARGANLDRIALMPR